MSERDADFSRLVSLACHDLRTPLATVHGFAQTLTRVADVPEPVERYLGFMAAASVQLTELLEDLSLAARIEGGRWEPNLQEVGLAELVASAAEEMDAGPVEVSGHGAPVRVDVDAARRALHGLLRCLLRHGGLERLDVVVEGTELRLAPVAPPVAPILLGENLRDLGAAVGIRVVEALGGSAHVDGETLSVRLPAA